MSIEDNEIGEFIQDPRQDLDREQTATEGEWVITEPLSRVQSEIQINQSCDNEQKIFKVFNLEEESNTIFYDSTTVRLIDKINKVEKVYSNEGESFSN